MIKLHVSEPELSGNEERYVLDCVRGGNLSMGRYVREFETAFAREFEVRNAIAVANGTVALHLALVALSIKPGDEVLVPALTYVATANAVTYCGATPIFCDVDPYSWCIDPDDAWRRITPRTRAIIPVHLYGHPADLDRLASFGPRIQIVEDAAEAHGAEYKSKPVGSIGMVGTFSFYGNKIITSGEGGMVTTNDDDLAAELRLYRGQGVDTSVHRYHHSVVGYNYRMTNLQGALGLAQLEQLPIKSHRRRQIFLKYMEWTVADSNPGFTSQQVALDVKHACWLFTVLVPEGVDRDVVMHKLECRGIETRPAFRCMHHLPIYATNDPYPVAEMISERGISLPTHTKMTDEDVHRVCKALEEAV